MMLQGFILFFAICSGPSAACEPALIMARSCQAAVQHVRRGMRPGQVLRVSGCEERR